MKATVFPLATALLCLIIGCNVGPDYKPPEITPPARFSQAPTTQPSTQPSTRPVSTQWWKTFNDPALDNLIDRAVAANLDLRIATARIREARALRNVTAADEWPQVNTAASYTRTRLSENSGLQGAAFSGAPTRTGRASSSGSLLNDIGLKRDLDLYQAGFDASWEIDVFGGTRRAVEAAEAQISASEENRRDVLVSLLAEVARNYIELRASQRELDINRSNLRTQKDTLDIAASKFKAGLVPEIDTQRAQSQLSSTEAQIPTLEAAIRRSIFRLSVLQGREPAALLDELLNPGPIPPIPPEVPVGLPSELLRRRPDVRRAERELAAATARIGAATADLFPRFSLTGSLGLQSNAFHNIASLDSHFWDFGPSVSWPIFDAGRIRANIRVQNARQEQALAAYEQTILIALEDVEGALINYANEQQRRRSLAQSVDAQRAALGLVTDRYNRGVTPFIDVLDTQRDLLAREELLVVSERNISANLVALYKALGGGWEDLTLSDTGPQKSDKRR